jgi:hypothetical protein
MFQGHRCNPYIVNINTKVAQVPLSFYPNVRRRMCSPNTLHDVGIGISDGRLDWANKIESIIFDEASALRAPLRVCSGSYAKSPLDFS